ncbi:MAG: M16 family metallopeptidase [Gammaproteobacteria bacterium]
MRVLILTILTALLLPFANSVTADSRTNEYVLDNGLKLIVKPDNRAPVAVVQIWYKVGASYEYDGITGVSHALEHMMFKGTEALGPGKFSELVAAKGGEENAFTSADYTAYFQTWAAENVPLSFEIEADRMRNLLLLEDEFKKEIRVVLEERRLRTDDNPQALLWESSKATAFQTSPYRQPVIGWAADLQNMSIDDLASWYRRWYAPNNAIVVVVGDVKPEEVHAAALKYFGPLERQTVAPPKYRPETAQQGTKTVTLESAKSRVPYLMMSYKAPSLVDTMGKDPEVEEWEVYALDVLASTLDGGGSARLAKNLVRNKSVATQVSANYSSGSRLSTLFNLSGAPSPNHSLDDLESALREEIKKLQTKAPTSQELERIKTQVVADTIYERDSMFYQGLIIGSLESVDIDWRIYEQYVDKIKAVTGEQVMAVANKYLQDDKLTIAKLIPAVSE